MIDLLYDRNLFLNLKKPFTEKHAVVLLSMGLDNTCEVHVFTLQQHIENMSLVGSSEEPRLALLSCSSPLSGLCTVFLGAEVKSLGQ